MANLAGKDVNGRSLRLDWDPGLDARGPNAQRAAPAAPYEKRRSPSPARGRSPNKSE